MSDETEGTLRERITQAAEVIREADAIHIAAGAGMGVTIANGHHQIVKTGLSLAGKLMHQSGFSRPGLARHQDHLALAGQGCLKKAG